MIFSPWRMKIEVLVSCAMQFNVPSPKTYTCNLEGLILTTYWICFCDFNPVLRASIVINKHNGQYQGNLPSSEP